MKRYNRISSNALCMIPRKAIAWIMLAMAILTIFSFILIEVKRILSLKIIPKENEYFYEKLPTALFSKALPPINSRSFVTTVPLNITISKAEKAIKVKTQVQVKESVKDKTQVQKWTPNVVEEMFETEPHCSTKPFLLILVVSAAENFQRRDAIRKTWANPERWKPWVVSLKTKVVFLVGKSSTKFLNILLDNEVHLLGDVLLGSYIDTYRNLTLKVIHGFAWALKHCSPTYVLKTDDDCFVNVSLLLHFLWKFNPIRSNLYAGRVRWSAPVVRDRNSRWYVSRSQFRESRYLPYVSGVGYVLSLDVLRRLIDFSDRVNIFPNEDAYVGTVLHVAGVKPTYSARFVTQSGPWQLCNFLYLFVVHQVTASRQNEFQDLGDKALEQCSANSMVKDWM